MSSGGHPDRFFAAFDSGEDEVDLIDYLKGWSEKEVSARTDPPNCLPPPPLPLLCSEVTPVRSHNPRNAHPRHPRPQAGFTVSHNRPLTVARNHKPKDLDGIDGLVRHSPFSASNVVRR